MRVYIGIPYYGGAGAGFVSSLLKLRVAFQVAGFEVECDIHDGCSILPKARNEIVSRFMKSGYDKLLFLDNDMVFDVIDVFKLLGSDHDICALDYRKKTDATVEYTSALTGLERDGWAQAYHIGMGCAVISREAIEAMQQKHPECRYVSDDGDVIFSLFDFLNKDGRYQGEDVTFCRRAIDSGFDIAVLKNANTGHIGQKEYR